MTISLFPGLIFVSLSLGTCKITEKMSTKILSGYSAAAFSLQVKEQRFLKHSPDFGWIHASHLTEQGPC